MRNYSEQGPVLCESEFDETDLNIFLFECWTDN